MPGPRWPGDSRGLRPHSRSPLCLGRTLILHCQLLARRPASGTRSSSLKAEFHRLLHEAVPKRESLSKRNEQPQCQRSVRSFLPVFLLLAQHLRNRSAKPVTYPSRLLQRGRAWKEGDVCICPGLSGLSAQWSFSNCFRVTGRKGREDHVSKTSSAACVS